MLASALPEPQRSYTVSLWPGAGGSPSFFAVGPLSHLGFSCLSINPSLTGFFFFRFNPDAFFCCSTPPNVASAPGCHLSLWFPNFTSLFLYLLGTPASQTSPPLCCPPRPCFEAVHLFLCFEVTSWGCGSRTHPVLFLSVLFFGGGVHFILL